MSESGGVNATSSLAIVEKKPQKSGGCVGILFKLFEWNRRFDKKKFFSMKLLPSARAKQDTMKFGGDVKQPKRHLITDENREGFPNAKKNGAFEQKHGVKPPSLVARLMGLEEAMPMVQPQDKLRKASSSLKKDKREKIASCHFEFGRESQELEKRGTKHEVRPPKLQKTSLLERHPLTKFGTEALHFKNVLSRSREHHHHHHPKLFSPVKNTRNLSGRNASRLMGAATKILEPGFQTRNRLKSALTYSDKVQNHPSNELTSETMKRKYPKISNHRMNEGKLLKGQSSCKNCSNLLDVVQCGPNMDDVPSVFVPLAPFPHISQMSKPGMSFSSLEQENEGVFRKRQEHSPSLAQAVDNIRNHQSQAQWHLTNQHSRPQTSPFSIGYKQNLQKQNAVRPNYKKNNRFGLASNAVRQTEDFVALNHGLNGQTWSKQSAKVDDFKFEAWRTFGNKREDLSPRLKRRSTNVSELGQSFFFVNSTLDRYIDGSGNKEEAMKKRGEITSKGWNVSTCERTPSKTLPNETDENICFRKPFPLTGDTLGALLDQKLKELTIQEENGRGLSGGIQPKQISAMILQELICVLATERRPCQKEFDFGPNVKPSEYHSHSLNSNFRLQGKSETVRAPLVDSFDDDYHSPGCVVETSSSNDSCLSSSLADSSGRILHDAMSCSYHEPLHVNFESDDFYSEASSSKKMSNRELVIDLLNYICEVLYHIDLSEARLKGNKLNHAKEVIFNAELVLGHASLTPSREIKSFSVSNFLLDELETLANVLWTNFSNFLGFEDTKEGIELKGFVFDCLIEYLDLTYGRFSKSIFGGWRNLHFCMNAEKMIHEVVEEVREWMNLGGLIRDEYIEREMSHGIGKWTDFEIQVFETGVDIEWMVLHSLVDELVVDLYECEMG